MKNISMESLIVLIIVLVMLSICFISAIISLISLYKNKNQNDELNDDYVTIEFMKITKTDLNELEERIKKDGVINNPQFPLESDFGQK